MVIPSKEPLVSLGAEVVRLGLSVGKQEFEPQCESVKLLSLVKYNSVDVDRVSILANNIGNIAMRDIMRNLPGSLGRGEFYIVTLCVPERTYIFLILESLIH